MSLLLNEDFDIFKKVSFTVLCNELSRCFYEGNKKYSKRNYKIDDRMICIFKFLYKVRVATIEQINRYLDLNGYIQVSEKFLTILNMKYGVLSYIDCKSDKKTTRVYVPAVGMIYILDKYTSLEVNENTDEYVFQQNINNNFIKCSQDDILKKVILAELYLNISQNSVNKIVYLENRVNVNQYINDEFYKEEIKFKSDILVSFEVEGDVKTYFIKYIDKKYDIRKFIETVEMFDKFIKYDELIDRYCVLSNKKPKFVFVSETYEIMQNLFNTIRNYDIDFNNICLSCLDIVFSIKNSAIFKEKDVFIGIASYV